MSLLVLFGRTRLAVIKTWLSIILRDTAKLRDSECGVRNCNPLHNTAQHYMSPPWSLPAKQLLFLFHFSKNSDEYPIHNFLTDKSCCHEHLAITFLRVLQKSSVWSPGLTGLWLCFFEILGLSYPPAITSQENYTRTFNHNINLYQGRHQSTA